MKHCGLLLSLMMMGLLGCQSAHKITPELFPQKLAAPFVQLLAEDGTAYNLADIYGEHSGTVVIFWQSKCPCVKRYHDRINRLYDQYNQDGLAMLYVSSNSDESFEEALLEYKNRNGALPLLRDQGGRLAQLLNAKGTPTAALFNQEGDLVYMGWIDNERYENESGRIAYLEDAIKALIAKRPVSTPTSPMFGCPIR